MPDFITDISSGSSNTDIKTVSSSDVIGPVLVKEFEMSLIVGAPKYWILQTPTITESEREFEEQKKLFEQIPPLLLEPYRGQFVVSKDGQVVASDEDFQKLAVRFFTAFGDVPAYITKIGEDSGIFIDTPFFD